MNRQHVRHATNPHPWAVSVAHLTHTCSLWKHLAGEAGSLQAQQHTQPSHVFTRAHQKWLRLLLGCAASSLFVL